MLKKILYTIWLFLFCLVIFISVKSANFNAFINVIENRTFDLRQNVMVNNKAKLPNKNIVIIAVDDASYEYILDRYGEWPLSRDIYAKLVDYIETQNPQSIAFDLMFVKSMKSQPQADNILINSFKKYDNLFTAMNLDNQPADLRIPPVLPEKISVDVDNLSKNVDFNNQTYKNCRLILQGILDSTSNIGMINVSRAEDGILRKMPLFVKYQNKFYPQLGFKVGMQYLKSKGNLSVDKLVIDKNSNLILGDRKIFLDEDGSAILNWYGPTATYEHIPLYKLIKIVNGELKNQNYDFKDKIVYFGTTASSLFDIKTVPVSRIYPGVEVQATYVNNLIDNNFIKKTDKIVTVIAGVILAVLTGIIVMKLTSAFVASLASLSIYLIYVLSSYYAMKFFNLWIELVYPLILALVAFISALVVKYFIKSRDFEQQYKLATTDGLTELYNHRYFQEQMKRQIENSKRYETEFSMIILDIDFFKKFNDTFGHQAGDAVLRQVAQTLKKNVRATDIVCRYGGEEMSIILPNTGKDVAYSTAEKICHRISDKKFKLSNDKETSVTISLGVATFPYDGQSASDIIDSADKRLYNAKNNGRNQVGK